MLVTFVLESEWISSHLVGPLSIFRSSISRGLAFTAHIFLGEILRLGVDATSAISRSSLAVRGRDSTVFG